MIKRYSFISTAVLVVALIMCGCETNEQKPVKGEARSALDLALKKTQNGYYNEAVALYKRALELDPEMPKAHLELGIIYDDYLGDKNKAIYHYSMYLKLDPDAEKAGMVREWIEKVRGKEAVAFSKAAPPTPEVVVDEAADYGDAREKIQSLELEIKAYLATIDELRKEVKRLTALQEGDLTEGTSPAKGKVSLERKYEKEKIELLKKFESEKDKLRSQLERANARIRVLEAQFRTAEAKLKKSTISATKKAATTSKKTGISRAGRSKPTPRSKPTDARRGVTIPSL